MCKLPAVTVRRRITIWLGDTEREPGDLGDFDVHSEDDMVAIVGTDGGGDEVEVFVCSNLHPAVRGVMDSLDD